MNQKKLKIMWRNKNNPSLTGEQSIWSWWNGTRSELEKHCKKLDSDYPDKTHYIIEYE